MEFDWLLPWLPVIRKLRRDLDEMTARRDWFAGLAKDREAELKAGVESRQILSDHVKAVTAERNSLKEQLAAIEAQSRDCASAYGETVAKRDLQIKELENSLRTANGLLNRRTDQIDHLVASAMATVQDVEQIRKEWHANHVC